MKKKKKMTKFFKPIIDDCLLINEIFDEGLKAYLFIAFGCERGTIYIYDLSMCSFHDMFTFQPR